MQIPDFPFKDEDGPSFVHHSVIRQYLQDYTQHFNLYPYIKVISSIFTYEISKYHNFMLILKLFSSIL